MKAPARLCVATAILVLHLIPAPASAGAAEQAPRWLKGNTHAHTTNSDGDSPPEVVTRWYQEHGYNFLVLSDHNYLTAEGSFPYARKDDFILIQGEEVTAFYRPSETVEKRPVHVNALNLKAVIETAFATQARYPTSTTPTSDGPSPPRTCCV